MVKGINIEPILGNLSHSRNTFEHIPKRLGRYCVLGESYREVDDCDELDFILIDTIFLEKSGSRLLSWVVV